MILIPTIVKSSPIHGLGVFSAREIQIGECVWEFDTRCDFRRDDFPEWLIKFVFRDSEGTGLDGDNARFINHSDAPNLISVGNKLIAAHPISNDEELTINYHSPDSQCELSKEENPTGTDLLKRLADAEKEVVEAEKRVAYFQKERDQYFHETLTQVAELSRLQVEVKELREDKVRLEWVMNPENEIMRLVSEIDGDWILDRSEIDASAHCEEAERLTKERDQWRVMWRMRDDDSQREHYLHCKTKEERASARAESNKLRELLGKVTEALDSCASLFDEMDSIGWDDDSDFTSSSYSGVADDARKALALAATGLKEGE